MADDVDGGGGGGEFIALELSLDAEIVVAAGGISCVASSSGGGGGGRVAVVASAAVMVNVNGSPSSFFVLCVGVGDPESVWRQDFGSSSVWLQDGDCGSSSV